MGENKSLWTTLKNKPKNNTSGFNLFATLKERAKLENLRPDAINFAKMQKVVEGSVFKKAARVEVKRNLLNITYFVIKNPKTNEYFRLDEREKFLWEKMDGEHTIRDLALEYYNQFGAFAYDKIVELVYDLKQKTFLEEEYVHIYQKLSLAAKSRRLLQQLWARLKLLCYWEFPLKNVDKGFNWLYRYGLKILFRPITAAALVGLAIIGVMAFVMVGAQGGYTILERNTVVVGGLTLLGLNFLSLFLHELAHGVATKHFGRQVHKAGFLIYFGWPSFYVDTTDMWFETKKRRILVSLVGPFAEVLMAGVISLVILFFPQTALHATLYKFALVSYVSVFVNMNPLVEWDGYFVLMDLVGVPCLRKRSLHFIRHDFWKKIGKVKLSREEMFYAVFGGLSAIWSVVAVVFGLKFWKRHIVKLFIFR